MFGEDVKIQGCGKLIRMSLRNFCFLLFLPCILLSQDLVVTYDKGSRLGDNLLCYLHAKWIAYEYHIPLRYKPFKYSSKLVLHDQELSLSKDLYKDKRFVVRLDQERIDLHSERATMYVCPYFPEDAWEQKNYYHFKVDWKNQEFRNIVRKMISPKKKLCLVVPPKNSVNIAIHVRDGGGFDPESAKAGVPLKLPPINFYAEGLSRIVRLFPAKDIYCYVFTDAIDPEKIVHVLQKALPSDSSVTFGYRKFNNRHNKNVLEDFFSLFNFDVLIRPQSNFSMVPSLIHDYAIVYHPTSAVVSGNQVVIDKVEMETNDDLVQKLLLKKKSFSRSSSKIWNWFHRH